MMRDKLICRGFELDLPKQLAFPLTFAIADAKDPTKRSRTFSASIDLPATARNKAFFAEAYGYHSIGSQIAFDPLANYSTEYWKKDTRILKDGVMMLKQVTFKDGNMTFKVQVYSDSTDAFLTLSSLKLADLDYTDLNHTLTRANIKASWLTADGVGYRYPLIQYRDFSGNNTWKVTDLVPYIHVKELVDRIFEYVGVDYSSTFLNGALFKKILFGFGGGDYINNSLTPLELANRRVKYDSGDFSFNNIYPWQGVQDINGQGIPNSPTLFPEKEVIGAGNLSYNEVTDVQEQFNGTTFEVQTDGNYKIVLNGVIKQTATLTSNVQYSGLFGIGYGGVAVFKNGVEIQRQEFTSFDLKTNYNISNPATYPTKTDTINFEADLSCASGDVLEVFFIQPQCEVAGVTWSDVAQLGMEVETLTPLTLDFTCIDTTVTDGSLIYMQKFMPDITCSEFLISLFRQFNLVMSEPDVFTGVVNIEPMVNFYKPADQFDDVTHLVDHSKDVELEPSGNTVSKYIKFEFGQMDEYDSKMYTQKWGSQYGSFDLINPSHFAKGTTTIKLPWSTIIPFAPQNVGSVMYPRFVIFEDGKIKPNRGSARMCFWNGLKSGKWRLVNNIDVTIGENLTQYPCIHHFDNWENPTFDLNFGLVRKLEYITTRLTTNNMYNVNHSPFYADLISPHGKYMRCYLKLNEQDIADRDLSKFWMINGMLFRKNIIGAYDSNVVGTTKVELIRVINATKPFRGRGIVAPRVPNDNVIVIKSPKDNVGVGVGVISSPRFDAGMYVKVLKG